MRQLHLPKTIMTWLFTSLRQCLRGHINPESVSKSLSAGRHLRVTLKGHSVKVNRWERSLPCWPPPFPLLTSRLLPSFPPLCPQCFSRIMGLSWGRKSAAPPVSSPARQDRCKVGGEGKKGVNWWWWRKMTLETRGRRGRERLLGSFRMITDERPHNMRTRCMLGRFKIDDGGMERLWSRGKAGKEARMRVEVTNERKGSLKRRERGRLKSWLRLNSLSGRLNASLPQRASWDYLDCGQT